MMSRRTVKLSRKMQQLSSSVKKTIYNLLTQEKNHPCKSYDVTQNVKKGLKRKRLKRSLTSLNPFRNLSKNEEEELFHKKTVKTK